MSRERCATEGCPNFAKPRAALCGTCLWRRQHQKPLGAPLRHRRNQAKSPEEALRDAARALAACEDTDTPWWRIPEWNRLRVAAQRWAKANGWKAPSKTHT